MREEEDFTRAELNILLTAINTVQEVVTIVHTEPGIRGSLVHGIGLPSVIPRSGLRHGIGLQPNSLVGNGLRPELLTANLHGHIVGVPPQEHGGETHTQTMHLHFISRLHKGAIIVLMVFLHKAESTHIREQHRRARITGGLISVVHQ